MKYFLQLLSIWVIGYITAYLGTAITSTSGQALALIFLFYFWASLPQLLFNFLVCRVWKYFYLLPLLFILIFLFTSFDSYNLVFLPYGIVNAIFIFFEKNEKEQTE